MKVFILTSELAEKNGWGRYSLDLLDALKARGVKIILTESVLPNPMTYKIYFLAPWYAWRLRNQARDSDIIHCLIEPYSHIAYWISIFTGKEYVVTAHGTWSVIPYSFSFPKRYLHKISFGSAKKIICVSHYTQKRLSKFGLTNLAVINNGINLKKFYHEPVSSLLAKENFIISVGALKHGKGHHVSIEAFSKVSSEFKGLKYYIVGDQSDMLYFNHLKKIASDLAIKDRVKFLQKIPDEELSDLYRRAKLFVLVPISNASDFEGFGLVYLEANVCGTPVIGSLDSGAEDAIRDGETGFLVPQNNPDKIAESIIRLLKDSDLWQHMSKGSIVWARKHDWSEVIREYVKIYSLIRK